MAETKIEALCRVLREIGKEDRGTGVMSPRDLLRTESETSETLWRRLPWTYGMLRTTVLVGKSRKVHLGLVGVTDEGHAVVDALRLVFAEVPAD